MTLELIEAVQNNALRVVELRKYPRDALVAHIETSLGTTTLLHQIMLVGNERLVRTALEIIGADKQSIYMTLDADNNTPVHAFAQRVVHSALLTKAVVEMAPLSALRAANKEGNTPVHLFPLCGNEHAVALCRARDPALVSVQNSYRQTPAELALERRRVDTESQLKSLKAENRRLTHNQSMADAEEAKLAEFYRRMDVVMKERDAKEAEMRQNAEKAAQRIKALEEITLTKERVMREAIGAREKAERSAAQLRERLESATATQSVANEAVERTRAELAQRETDVAEQQAALREAFQEIQQLRTETNDALADDQQAKIVDAEARAAALQERFGAEQAQRDRVAKELATQQSLVQRLQNDLDEARRRVGEVETTKTRAEADESAARARFDEMRNEVERAQREERRAFETQIAALREQNERNRDELTKLQLSDDEAKRLRETLDAERDRWRAAHEESEQRVQTLLAELEAEQTRPVSVTPQLSPRSLQRRPSSTKISVAAAVAVIAADDAAQSRRPLATVSDEAAHDKFFNNVALRVLECDCDTLALLVSSKLELEVNAIVDRTGAGLLEQLMMKILQTHYVVSAAIAAGRQFDAAALARAPEMFELLVRAGARWAGLPKYIAEHRVRLSPQLVAKLDTYEQWWVFADVFLAGEKTKDAHQALARALPTIGDPNHVLTQFHSKSLREQFAGREMTYLHLALELFNEQVVAVVDLLLTVPGVDVNRTNSHAMTPLHTAINRFHRTPGRCAALVESLMAAGADPLRSCDNAEMIEHWAALAADAVPRHAPTDYDKTSKREASEAVTRAKALHRARKQSAKYANDELTWLTSAANKYTTPYAMANISGASNERLVELLTHERYRRVETRALAGMIVERAMLHHWLLEAFATGALSRYPALARYFEFLQHVLHCFNPYTTSVILMTGLRPRILKTKLGVGLAQSIVDPTERQICETIARRLEEPGSIESKSLLAQPPATPRGGRFGSMADAHGALEQLTADLEGNGELAVVWQLASALLRVVKASEMRVYDVSSPILASVIERYDEAVEQAMCTMLERRGGTPPAAFVYVVARDDAQFGPHVCYDSTLPPLSRTVLQALVVNGDVEKLEAIYARASETLDHRFATDRTLVKLAVDNHQPLVLAWFDYVAERAATQRRRAFEARSDKNSLVASAIALKQQRAGAPVERDAKQCKAANREHYLAVTLEGSTILHLCVEARRDDLLDFVLTTVFTQLAKCDVRGRRPIELATAAAAASDKLPTAEREALARCVTLLRGNAHLGIPALTLPISTSATSSPRKSPATPSSASILSPRAKECAKADEQGDPDGPSTPDALLSPRAAAEEAPTPRRRHRHRSSCTNKEKL